MGIRSTKMLGYHRFGANLSGDAKPSHDGAAVGSGERTPENVERCGRRCTLGKSAFFC
jgi:hypothetical protein